MEIIRGKKPGAKKVVVYGPEGIGKSTFAAHFPDPLFIDTEGSTKDMDVARTPDPSSWSMLMEQVEYIRTHPDICRTLAVDTIDWAEQMCVKHICDLYQKRGIEDFGYGNGYVYVKEEFGRFLNKLSEVVNVGINVVLTAHAQMRKFEQPDEMGSYDRWELKLGKKTTSQTSPLVKEWADMVLFANYKTYSVAVDDKGKKRKAQGGSRVMYTAHHPCWDAKNRYGLPEEMPFDYSGIAGIIEAFGQSGAASSQQHANTIQKQESSTDRPTNIPDSLSEDRKIDSPPKNTDSGHTTGTGGTGSTQADQKQDPVIWESNPENVPQNLKDLMMANEVSEWDIQNVVGARGYYTADTPIEKYDPGFIQGVLVGAWQKVYLMIKEMKESGEIPFN